MYSKYEYISSGHYQSVNTNSPKSDWIFRDLWIQISRLPPRPDRQLLWHVLGVNWNNLCWIHVQPQTWHFNLELLTSCIALSNSSFKMFSNFSNMNLRLPDMYYQSISLCAKIGCPQYQLGRPPSCGQVDMSSKSPRAASSVRRAATSFTVMVRVIMVVKFEVISVISVFGCQNHY